MPVVEYKTSIVKDGSGDPVIYVRVTTLRDTYTIMPDGEKRLVVEYRPSEVIEWNKDTCETYFCSRSLGKNTFEGAIKFVESLIEMKNGG